MFSRLMRANLASIMPQAIEVWAEEAGHDVHFICYTGIEDLATELETDLDVLFISAFTRSAHIAYALSNMCQKTGTGRRQGEQKVLEVSDQVNMILRHIPYLQANFVLGLDGDEGAAPFELTKKFIDLTPGAFPAYSLLSAFGEAVPQNIDLQSKGRVLGFPYYFLDNNKSMNVRPLNYEWPEFYDHLIDLMRHSFSPKALYRRFGATKGGLSKFMNLVRAGSSEGYFRLQYHKRLRAMMDTDPSLLSYLNQETSELPAFYTDTIKKSLGEFHQFLPEGGMLHDQNAYLKKDQAELPPEQIVVRDHRAPVELAS